MITATRSTTRWLGGAFNMCAALAITVSAASAFAADNTIIVQSTTSTANSGLYKYLLPMAQQATGVQVRVVAVGTGQAIKNAERCDADVLLVHAKSAEQQFVDRGFGTRRHDLMYNDFVLVGPPDDPAGVRGSPTITAALQRIASSQSLFASRGDQSGTHKKEMNLWQQADVNPVVQSGQWYRETGSGMGATLNTGIGMGAYVLTDRATWLSFGNKAGYDIVMQGDKRLFNQYGVILVSQQHCPNVRSVAGQAFIDWLLSADGQEAIASFQVNGKQLFYPNARL